MTLSNEEPLTWGATVWLAVLAVAAMSVWGLMRDVLLPAHNLVRFSAMGVGLGCAIALLCHRPSCRQWWRNAALVAAVGVALIGVTTLCSRAEESVREHEGELTAVAHAALARGYQPPDGCTPAPGGLSAGDLGPFDQVCVGGGGVEFRRNDPAGHTDGLLYVDSNVRPPSTCVRPLFGPWVQFSRPADPNCPFGFDFIGGG